MVNLEMVRDYHLLNLYAGKAQITLYNGTFNYEGELDEDDKPCGYGCTMKYGIKFNGTWFDGKEHGVCKFCISMIYLSLNANYKGKVIYSDGDTVISEYKNGQEHGRATLYGNR